MSRAAPNILLALSILGCFGGGSLYGWSGYLPAVRAAFGVSNAAASMVFSLALASFTAGVLMGPMVLAKIPPRWRLPLITGGAATSLGVAGFCTEITGFAVAYGACFGFASGSLYNQTISMASASVRPALLVPISVAAFGFGGAVFGPIQFWLSTSGWGLRSTLPALVCMALVAGVALFIPTRPDPSAKKRPSFVKPDKTIALLWVIFAAGSCSGLIVLGLASQFFSQTAEGVGFVSLAIFLAALGNTVGRLSSAATSGWFGPAHAIAGALSVSILSLAGLIVTNAPAMIAALVCLVAFAYGQLAATTPLLVRSQVEASAFSGAFGWVFTGWGVAGLIGPWTAGGLLDATGTLRIPLVACMALAALSFWLVLRIPNRDWRQENR